MAAITSFLSGVHTNVVGRKRTRQATIAAPANGDTWDTGLVTIDNVQITFAGTPTAADATSFTTSGGVITFVVVGTARDLSVAVTGI